MIRLLDLFCGAGGASVGYHRAGFQVVGVDWMPQRNYPFEFIHARWDAVDLRGYDLIHASPPCRAYSRMTACWHGARDEWPDLIPQVREALQHSGVPYVIENVPTAPLVNPIMLCGHMFNLPLYRHRCFESSLPIPQPVHRPHTLPSSPAGHWRPGTIMAVAGNFAPVAQARIAMGIDWMGRNELAEAIPPVYTEYIGKCWGERYGGGVQASAPQREEASSQLA